MKKYGEIERELKIINKHVIGYILIASLFSSPPPEKYYYY